MGTVQIHGSVIHGGEMTFYNLHPYDEERIRKDKNPPHLSLGAQVVISGLVNNNMSWDKCARLLYSYVAIQLLEESIRNFTKIEVTIGIVSKHCDFNFIPSTDNPEIIEATYRLFEPRKIETVSFERYPLLNSELDTYLLTHD